MRNRYYSFKTSDGQIEVLTIQDAFKLDDPLVKKRIIEIINNSQNIRRKKDGFEPGWQENIQAYAGGPREYQSLLREKGLVEIGKDYIPTEEIGDHSFFKTDSFIEACKESGIELSDNEAAAIKSGEYFKNVSIE